MVGDVVITGVSEMVGDVVITGVSEMVRDVVITGVSEMVGDVETRNDNGTKYTHAEYCSRF